MKNIINFMELAYSEAKLSNDVPIGAVLVYQNEAIFSAVNESKVNPFLHAEARVLQKAYELNLNMSEVEIYVTLEPCIACAGLLSLARVKKVVFGARSGKFGAVVSDNKLFSGVYSHTLFEENLSLSDDILNIMQNFFKNKRI